MGESINGYTLISEFTNDNSGFARWAFAKKDGIEVFIKEFLSPVYPSPDAPISEEIRRKKECVCSEFENSKRALYTALRRSATGNIVTVLDMFRYRSKYYIITEKVDMKNMSIAELAGLNVENKVMILKVLTHCVNSLHKNGIVHGDLKPDNILIKKTAKGFYTAKLIDFDSSFLDTNPPVSSEELHGDLVYFAPEAYLFVAEEGSVALSAKIDVFALGVIFHQYFTGHLPQFDKEYDYLFEAVLDGGEVVLDSTLPVNLRMLIEDMIKAEPDLRPSLNDVFDRFSLFCHGPAKIPVVEKARAAGANPQMREAGGPWKIPDDLM